MWMLLLLAVADWSAVERLIERGDYSAAQSELARMPGNSARWHVLSSKIADGRNDPAAAVSAAEAALRIDPRNESAHVQLGSIFLSHNTPDAALDVFTDAQAVLPQSLLVRLGRGLAFKELQRWDDAETELTRCLPNLLAFDALATILIQRGRFADAAQLAQRFLGAAPNDYRPWYFTASAKEAQDLPGVESDVRRSIRLRPQFAAAHALLGKWLLKQDRLAEAAVELEEAARLRPDLVQAHLHLAQTYQRLKRKDDAAREFNIVRDLKQKEKTPRQRLLFHRGASPNR
jgi:tetratricopeptide (TPR) repeat protein